jgi:hypothetical protein
MTPEAYPKAVQLKNHSFIKVLAEGNSHPTDVLAPGAKLPLSRSLTAIEENGNAIDRSSSHRERIQSRAKASDNSKN